MGRYEHIDILSDILKQVPNVTQQDIQTVYIVEILKRVNGNREAAARILGISRKSVARQIELMEYYKHPLFEEIPPIAARGRKGRKEIDFDVTHFIDALINAKGNRSAAARALKMPVEFVYRRIELLKRDQHPQVKDIPAPQLKPNKKKIA